LLTFFSPLKAVHNDLKLPRYLPSISINMIEDFMTFIAITFIIPATALYDHSLPTNDKPAGALRVS
jgi:hypothetical protein